MDLLILLAAVALVVFAFWSASKCQAKQQHREDYSSRKEHPDSQEDFAAIPLDTPGQNFWQEWYYRGDNLLL